MNSWNDNGTVGGIFGRILDPACILAIAFAVGLSAVTFHNSANIERQCVSGFLTFFLTGYLIIFILLLKYKYKTIMIANLYSGRISGYCYNLRPFTIDFIDILSIRDQQRKLVMGNRCFRKQSGFEIELKNGKLYYVSSCLNDASSLRKVLSDSMDTI